MQVRCKGRRDSFGSKQVQRALGSSPAGSHLRSGHRNDAARAGGLQQPQHIASLGLHNHLRTQTGVTPAPSRLQVSCIVWRHSLGKVEFPGKGYAMSATIPPWQVTYSFALPDVSEACACIYLQQIRAASATIERIGIFLDRCALLKQAHLHFAPSWPL